MNLDTRGPRKTAQQFFGERTSSVVNELSRLRGSELAVQPFYVGAGSICLQGNNKRLNRCNLQPDCELDTQLARTKLT